MTMKPLILHLLALLACASFAHADPAADGNAASVIVMTGAGGTPEYAAAFSAWAARWEKAAATAGVRITKLEAKDNASEPVRASREQLRAALDHEPKEGAGELWLVLLGHGTWDGQTGKFNAEGDDISIADLKEWLAPIKRPVVVIAGFSSSGAFLKPLSAPGRVIVTATRSGSEENFSRFGDMISTAIGNPAADLDKDGEVSLLEAWLSASRAVSEFYSGEGRLATEHSLLDDNGDGLGTPPDWFDGTRIAKKPKNGAEVDGLRAGQITLVRSASERALPPEIRAQRNALELEVAKLRDAKATMPEAEFYEKLEKLMLQIAWLYEGK